MPRLTLSGVQKHFGATVALEDGCLDLRSGEINVLMGANGSGKSTLCKIISGSVKPDNGKILLDGKEIRIDGPISAQAFGISTFYQELSLAGNRSSIENISLAQLPMRRGFVDRREMLARAVGSLAPFKRVIGKEFDLATPVNQLRADQMQLVEIMKAFAPRSNVLIFDEPTSALDHAQTEAFFAELRRRKAKGVAVVFISHRMEEIFEIADRVTVIRDGRTISCEPLSETSKDRIVNEMAGEEGRPATSTTYSEPQPFGDVRLRVNSLTNARLHGVSIEVRAGEIVGLGGLHGQGQSDLLRAVFGASSATGTVSLDGKELVSKGPRQAIKNGLAYVSGDRGRDGVINGRSILENVSPIHFIKQTMALVHRKRTRAKSRGALSLLSAKYSELRESINSLSGGNQQKVVIARWLIDRPEVMLLDDPTKGIDLATKIELFALIRSLATEGMAIVLYSSEDAELLANSDRIFVFNNGAVSRELVGDEKTQLNLTQAAFEAA